MLCFSGNHAAKQSRHTILGTLIAVALAAGGLATLSAAGGAQHRPDWEIVSISGSSQLNPATNTFVGSGTIVIEGENVPVSWESVVLGTLGQDADGTLHLASSHTFVSTERHYRFEFTTFDTITAVPTGQPGQYTLTTHLKLNSGSGIFGKGEIVANGGSLDFINGTVTIPSALGKLGRSD